MPLSPILGLIKTSFSLLVLSLLYKYITILLSVCGVFVKSFNYAKKSEMNEIAL